MLINNKTQPILCEECGEVKASVYCKADKIALCWDCDNENHNKVNKLASKH